MWRALTCRCAIWSHCGHSLLAAALLCLEARLLLPGLDLGRGCVLIGKITVAVPSCGTRIVAHVHAVIVGVGVPALRFSPPEISTACSILSDMGMNGGGGGGGFQRYGNADNLSPEDIFEMFFNGGVPGGFSTRRGGVRFYRAGGGGGGGQRGGNRGNGDGDDGAGRFIHLLQLLPLLLLLFVALFNFSGNEEPMFR